MQREPSAELKVAAAEAGRGGLIAERTAFHQHVQRPADDYPAAPDQVDYLTRLDSAGPTSTRVFLEIEIHAPPLMGFIAREAERRINAELFGALGRFKALVEAEGA